MAHYAYTGTCMVVDLIFPDGTIYNLFSNKEEAVRNISMHWLKVEDLCRPMTGLVFLFDSRGSIFSKERDVVASVRALVVNGTLPDEVLELDWAGGLLVQGFDAARDHPVVNTMLSPKIHHRGKEQLGNARTVYEFMSDEDYGLGIYAGLTVHDTCGSWSSWPVHEYEVLALTSPVDLYPDFSEQFALMTQPPYGWCLQSRVKTSGECEVEAYRDGDIIDIPLGAHPTVAMPGSRIAYFWAYKGASHKDF